MIIILTQCFPSRIGGIESLMYNLSIALSDHKKILVLADAHDAEKDRDFDLNLNKKVEIKRVSGLKFFRRRKKINLLKSILNIHRVDCIIGDSWKSLELVIKFLNTIKIKTICLAHGNELVKKNNRHFKRIQYTLNNVSSVVCNSNFTKGLVENLEITTPLIKTIYPGAQDSSDILEKHVSKINGNPIILTLSRLEKRKGHQYVIDAVSKLKDKYPDILYVIAGTGKELSNLKKLVNKLKLDNHVIFVGDVNENEKKFLFNKASVMVLPTTNEIENRSIEGFGISYIEASFHKVPSIASNIGGTKEAVLHNSTGIVLENIESLYKKLELLFDNKTLLKNLGEAAYERAIKEFKWPFVAKKYLKIIEELN